MVVAQILLLTCQVKHESQEINKKVDSSRKLPCGLQPCSFRIYKLKKHFVIIFCYLTTKFLLRIHKSFFRKDLQFAKRIS